MPPQSTLNILAKLIRVARYAVFVWLYWFSKVMQKSEISVLMYHSIGMTSSKYTVSPSEFRRQLDYLRKNYDILPIENIAEFLEGKRTLRKKTIAITFDDGFLDNYLNAYPCLRKYRLPATIFIATGFVQREMYLGNSILPMLGWDEIVLMSQNLVDFGAHTVTHPDLTRIEIEKAKQEILESKGEIERRVGRMVYSFSYPFGRFQGSTVNLVRRLGFRCAFGGGGHVEKDCDRYAVNRVEVKRSTNFALFKIGLTLALDWYEELEERLKQAFGNFPFMSLIFECYNSLES